MAEIDGAGSNGDGGIGSMSDLLQEWTSAAASAGRRRKRKRGGALLCEQLSPASLTTG
jgi:hypothetical protein